MESLICPGCEKHSEKGCSYKDCPAYDEAKAFEMLNSEIYLNYKERLQNESNSSGRERLPTN